MAGEVKMMPVVDLEWEGDEDEAKASALFGEYLVVRAGDGYRLHLNYAAASQMYQTVLIEGLLTMAEVKAHANLDNRKRINGELLRTTEAVS